MSRGAAKESFAAPFLEASRYRACASPAYAFLQTRHHGLQPWLHSNAAPRLFGLNQISSEYSFFRAGSGVLNVLFPPVIETARCGHQSTAGIAPASAGPPGQPAYRRLP